MKILILIIMIISLVSCGMSEVGTKGTVQIKRIHKITPMIACSDYYVLDASLGIMTKGVGSMSTQDIDLTISKQQATELEVLLAHGKSIVNVTYDTRRLTFCEEERVLVGYDIVDSKENSLKQESLESTKTERPDSKPSNPLFEKCISLAKSVSELSQCKNLFDK